MSKPKRLPILREDRTIEIPLTNGYSAIIDWEDVWLCAFNWNAFVAAPGYVYASRGHENRVKFLHREMFGLGPRNGFDVDHKNGETLDCRRSNLRVVSCKENARNRKVSSRNKSGVPGVWQNKTGSWSVTLSSQFLGTYADFESARHARLKAERELWGIQPQRREQHEVSDEILFPKRLERAVRRSVYTPRVKIRKLSA